MASRVMTDFTQRTSILDNVHSAEEGRFEQLSAIARQCSALSDRIKSASATPGSNSQMRNLNSVTALASAEAQVSQLRLAVERLKNENLTKESSIVLTRKIAEEQAKQLELNKKVSNEVDGVRGGLGLLIDSSAARITALQSALKELTASAAEAERKLASVSSRNTKLTSHDVANLVSNLENLRQKNSIKEAEIRRLEQQVGDDTAEIDVLQMKLDKRRGEQSPRKYSPEQLALLEANAKLEQALESSSQERSAMMKQFMARSLAAAIMPEESSSTAMMNRIQGTASELERMTEAMALLKSTVIHFEHDLKKMRSVQRLSEADQENCFKGGHNEVKICVGMCLPKEEGKRFSKTSHQCELWPITQEMLDDKFPSHKIEAANSALQEMVIAWDGFSAETKARLNTAQEVVVNAHLLFMIALYVTARRNQKWAEKYQQLMGASNLRLHRGSVDLLPRHTSNLASLAAAAASADQPGSPMRRTSVI